ncbi:hypothetical protein ACSBOB_14795 [Mesorhizobium sp. ASY16-5R]|uniref:hypothetical protein n=1 Tax=Mesorhizobium sp. ASY16-5R TaxID=3445772 RepID=UPI003F9F3DD0
MTVTTSSRRARIIRRDNSWTYSETEIIRSHWPDSDAIRSALKHRSSLAITNMAKRLGLVPQRDQHIWTAAEISRLRRLAASGASRQEMARELGVTLKQVTSQLNRTRIHVAKRRPVMVGDELVDAVRQRAFDVDMSLATLDRSLGRRKTFQTIGRGKPVNPVHIHEAVKALGGRLLVQWPSD